jgi:hypothetical protein
MAVNNLKDIEILALKHFLDEKSQELPSFECSKLHAKINEPNKEDGCKTTFCA